MRKRWIVFCLVLTMILPFTRVEAAAVEEQTNADEVLWSDGVTVNRDAFAGKGTEEEPYQIRTAQDLVQMSVNAQRGVYGWHDRIHFELTEDIDLAGKYWKPFDMEVYLDGKGHTIKNMKIKASLCPGIRNIGFISDNLSFTVKNLNIENADVVVDQEDVSNAGILAGEGVSFENCKVANSRLTVDRMRVGGDAVGGVKNGARVGGMAGRAYTCNHCSGENLDILLNEEIEYAGGLFGSLDSARNGITHCTVTDFTITGSDKKVQYTGGIAGSLWAYPLRMSYAIGTIDIPNATRVAGLVAIGMNDYYYGDYENAHQAPRNSYAAVRIGETNGKKYGAAPPYAEQCFYDRTLCSDVSDSGSVIGKETSEMQTYALAKQLDEDGFVWTQQDSVNHGYPFLEMGTEIPVCHVPDDLAANDGASIQSLHIQNLPGNTPGRWEWANGTETFTIDADTYDAYFVPDDYKTYKAVAVQVPVCVTKDIQNAVVTLGEPLVYNGTEQTQLVESVVVDGMNVTYDVMDNVQKHASDQYELTIKGNGKFTGEIKQNFTIKPFAAALTVAGDHHKKYGQADPEWTCSANLFEGDSLKGQLQRVPGEDVGTYTYDISGFEPSDYTFSLSEDVRFTIEKAACDADVKILVENAEAIVPEIGDTLTVKIQPKNSDAAERIEGTDLPDQAALKVSCEGREETLDLTVDPEDASWSGTYVIPEEAIGKELQFHVELGDGEKNYITNQDISKTVMVSEAEPDPVRDFVERLYTEILERPADPEGLASWTENLKNGKSTGAQAAMGFVDSDEFKDKNKGDREFIEIMYRTFLGREADEGGLKAWSNVLDEGMSRMFVFRGFVESDEFTAICEEYSITRGNVELNAPMDQLKNEKITKFVARCYQVFLGRKGDAGGINGWVRQLASGENNAKEAAHGFVMSQEFQGKNLSDEDYVRTIYIGLLNREADPAGLASWVKVLEKGGTRVEIFYGFADSPEFRDLARSYGLSGDWKAN